MKTNPFSTAPWLIVLLFAAALHTTGQTTNADFQQAVAMEKSPPIPEEARKHFVMGTTLFKDAKTAEDYLQVESEFKQATDLAPQWPEARYNLALAKEAAGDYSGAMDDLKLYQQFKLSDREARTVQDKIYALEAKQKKAEKDKEIAAKLATEKAAQDAQLAAERKEKEREKGRDGRFIAYKDGTVLDTETKLMWAAEDDGGQGISWSSGKSYCENYRAGGYADWRMPTLDELETLYDATKSRANPSYPSGGKIHVATTLIILSGPEEWAADPRSDRMYDPSDRQWHFQANFFEFGATTRSQTRSFTFTEGYASNRVIPVRSVK